jgi:glycine oxidase
MIDLPGKKETFNLIVGGGIIGLSLAWELARRLHPVCVIESQPTERPASSWAGAGILPPSSTVATADPYEQLKSLSHQLHPVWAQQLQADTGIDTGFRKCGGIYLASSPAEAATLVANQYWWDQHGIEYRRLEARDLIRLEPWLRNFAAEKMRSAWLLPGEYQTRNPRLLQALRVACQQLGVEFLSDTVSGTDISSSGKVSLRTESGRQLVGQRVCFCSGAWTRMLLEQLGLPNGIMPVRGQMVLYRSPEPLLSHVINEGNRYLVPREDGYLLAGSVEEEVGFACQTTESAIQLLKDWSEAIVPELRQSAAIEKYWAGLRPGSFDGFPYLGAVPGTDNLYVAAGHFRSGLHLSCGTAVVMANLLLGQPNEIDLGPFRVGRG